MDINGTEHRFMCADTDHSRANIFEKASSRIDRETTATSPLVDLGYF
jgi:hypothetical protein